MLLSSVARQVGLKELLLATWLAGVFGTNLQFCFFLEIRLNEHYLPSQMNEITKLRWRPVGAKKMVPALNPSSWDQKKNQHNSSANISTAAAAAFLRTKRSSVVIWLCEYFSHYNLFHWLWSADAIMRAVRQWTHADWVSHSYDHVQQKLFADHITASLYARRRSVFLLRVASSV